jgi:hypothetical protein
MEHIDTSPGETLQARRLLPQRGAWANLLSVSGAHAVIHATRAASAASIYHIIAHAERQGVYG